MNKIKHYLALMLLSLCSMSSYAYDFEVDGLYFNLISASEKTCEVVGCDKSITNLEIPNTIQSRGVSLTVVNISQSAFANNDNLKTVIIKTEKVDSISNSAFEGCYNIEKVILSNGISVIGASAFKNCEKLQILEFPTSLKVIRFEAFKNCLCLNNITFPDNIELIESNSIEGCPISDMNLPGSLKEIGKNILPNLHTLVISRSDTPIKIESQFPCLENISIDRNLAVPFLCNSAVENVTFGIGCTEMVENCFKDCRKLQSIVIPGNLTKINDGAFDGCVSLTEIVFEDSKDSIVLGNSGGVRTNYYQGSSFGSNWYYYEYHITDIFRDCPLTTVYLGRNLIYQSGISKVSNIPNNEYNYYSLSSPFKEKPIENLEISSNVTKIGHALFKGCEKLSKLSIPVNCTEIADSAFAFSGLQYVNLSNIKSIGKAAFLSCRNLLEVKSSGDLNIGIDAFRNCKNLQTASFLSVRQISRSAFLSNAKLESLYLGNNIERIEDSAFSGCTSLSKIGVYCQTPPSCGEDVFKDVNKWDATLYLPNGSSVNYQNADCWKDFLFMEETELVMPDCSKITSIKFHANSIEVLRGDQVKLTPVIEPIIYLEQIEWNSTDPTIATVSSTGVVTALKFGTVVVEAKSTSCIATCTIVIPENPNEIVKHPTSTDYSVGLKYDDNTAKYQWFVNRMKDCKEEEVTCVPDNWEFNPQWSVNGSYPNKWVSGQDWSTGSSELSATINVLKGDSISFDWTIGTYKGSGSLDIIINGKSVSEGGVGKNQGSFLYVVPDDGILKLQIKHTKYQSSTVATVTIPVLKTRKPHAEHIEGQTSAILSDFSQVNVGENVFCQVEINGRVLNSNTAIVTPQNFIKTQPTEDNLCVELDTPDEGARYQWYKYTETKVYRKTIAPISSGAYGWSENDGVWTSDNKGVNYSSATMSASFDVQARNELSFDWKVSGGFLEDFFEVYINGEKVIFETGTKSSTFEKWFDSASTVSIDFVYSKTESSTHGADCATVSNIKLYNSKGFIEIENTEIEGATTSVLDRSLLTDNCEVYCVVTFPNGMSLTSDKVSMDKNKDKSVIYSGPCGDRVTYTLYDDYSVVIEGKGEMWDCSFDSPLLIYSDKKIVDIKDGVTSVGKNAFNGCTSLTTVIIGNSVKSIEDNAFRDCSNLTTLTIGNSVTKIGMAAFSKCSSLTKINIPNSVTSIGLAAFGGCSGLISVNIPNSVRSIDMAAFSGCSGLTSVNIGNSVENIGDNAFANCTSLSSVIIPNSVERIGTYAFRDCM